MVSPIAPAAPPPPAPSDAVRYSAQALTAAQKTQARANMDAAPSYPRRIGFRMDEMWGYMPVHSSLINDLPAYGEDIDGTGYCKWIEGEECYEFRMGSFIFRNYQWPVASPDQCTDPWTPVADGTYLLVFQSETVTAQAISGALGGPAAVLSDINNSTVNSALFQNPAASRGILQLGSAALQQSEDFIFFEGYHPKTVNYVAALLYYGGSPTQAFVNRLDSAFRKLDQGGILGDLVNGAYYASDGQRTSGAPLDLLGIPAKGSPGSWSISDRGAVFDAADNQVIIHAIADTRFGTLCTDYRYDGSAIAYGQSVSLCPVEGIGNAMALSVVSDNGSALKFYIKNSGSFVFGSTLTAIDDISKSWFSYSQNRMRFITTFGDSTSTQLLNGNIAYLAPSSDLTYDAATAIEEVCIGGANQIGPASWVNVFKGEFSTWLLFDKKLSLDEQRCADKAMQILDGRPILWVAEGDSTVEALPISARANDNWPYLLGQETGWNNVRMINLGTSGHSLAGIVGVFAQEAVWNQRTAYAQTAYYSISGNINGIAAGRTAAESYADLMLLVTMANLTGFRTVVLTMAVPDWTGGDAALIPVADDYNDLLRAGYENGDFDYLIDVAVLIPSHVTPYDVLWEDAAHLNAAGNALIAAEIASQITV